MAEFVQAQCLRISYISRASTRVRASVYVGEDSPFCVSCAISHRVWGEGGARGLTPQGVVRGAEGSVGLGTKEPGVSGTTGGKGFVA